MTSSRSRKYNQLKKKTETYTVDVPNYIQVKNYTSQKEYDWIIITGGVCGVKQTSRRTMD